MRAFDLASLSFELCRSLPSDSEMSRVLSAIMEALLHARDYKTDKDGERLVKEMLYRMETLFREIEEFMEESQLIDVVISLMGEIQNGEEGEYSRSIGKELRSSIASEMEIILKELKPYSVNKKSLISTETMVGAEFHHQKEQLIELLLDSNSSPRLTILGKPGTGKSTLIWDALHDSRLQNHFNDIMKYAVSSYDGWNCKTRSLIVLDDTSNVDTIKYLLSVDEETLLNLNLFKGDAKGSKFVIISSLQLHLEHVAAFRIRLPSLNDDESWILFQSIAFTDPERPHSTLVDMGRKICHKCENIPGVINIVASILSSKPTTQEWEHFLHIVMTSVPDPITTISSTFEFTKQLSDSKRYRGHCFAWCSLLPKDYEFQKDHLLHLWRAQECFAEYNYFRKEDIQMQLGHCFHEFLRSGYFLESGTIDSTVSYKINHLAFELMKYVGGDDFCLVDKTTPEPNNKIIRHASFIVDPSWETPSWLPKAKQLQSLLLWPRHSNEFIPFSRIDVILSRMTHLRALHSEAILCERFPDYLVKFKKLVYLRFGAVSSISLPEDIPNLVKLLNNDFRFNSIKLLVCNGGDSLLDENLEQEQRHDLLIIFAGFKWMTIQYEKFFEQNSFLNPHQVRQWKKEALPSGEIDELSGLLVSLISIQIADCSQCQHLPAFNTLPLLSSLQLRGMCSLVDITISRQNGETSSTKPFYPSLKCLALSDLPKLKGWSSTEAPILEHYFFPLLAEVRIHCCPKLISMPSVPNLQSLKAFNADTRMLNHLMFPPVIDPSLNDVDYQELIEASEPNLRRFRNLEIEGCKELVWGDKPNGNERGLWREMKSVQSLKLTNIPELTSLSKDPECFMTIKQLSLCWLANLKVLPDWKGQFTQLRKFTIHHCPKLIMLPKSDGSFSALEQLEIRYCPRVCQFPKSLTNLKRLQVQEFGRLKQILRMSQNLEELEINNCDQLEWETPNVERDTSPNVWENLNSLHSLKLTKMDTYPKGLDFAKLTKLSRLVIEKCPKLISLPDSLCSLSTLEHLRIYYYPGLINLPNTLKNLSFLKKLEIRVSTQLEKRCKPDGEDWYLIQHIADIVINDSPQQVIATWNAVEEERDLVCAD